MNRCGSSRGGGGAAHEMESEHCRLAGVDFLGDMEVDLGAQICKMNKENETGSRKGRKKVSGGEMNSRASIYRAQNIRRFTAAKGSSHR